MTKISYLPLFNLVNDLVVEIKEEVRAEASEGEWYIHKHILPKFTNVLPEVKQLVSA